MKLDIKKYKCAIFDLDGTLLNSSDVWEKIDVEFLGKRGIKIPDDYGQEIKKHNFESGAIYTVHRFQLQEKPEDILKEWMDMARKEYHECIQLKENAKDFLLQVKQSGLKLAVATSSDAELFKVCLQRLGVYDLFDCFTLTSEVKRGKTFPDVYEEAARRCQTAVEDCIVFEDILCAVEAAKNGGFFTVGVQDEASSKDSKRIKEIADVYINNYAELMS